MKPQNNNKRAPIKKGKKIEMAQESNTRVIYCNAPETEIFLKLAAEMDKLFFHLRSVVGAQMTFEEFFEYRNGALTIASATEEFILESAKELKLSNISKSLMLSQIMNLESKEE